LRQTILSLAVLAVCGATHLAAQSTRPGSPAGRTAAHSHSKPVPVQPSTASGPVLDAASLGSPLPLDKDWRVGISSDPAAASPGFDDSRWALRNAQSFMSDVQEDDGSESAAPAPATPSSGNQERHANHRRRYVWLRLHIRLAAHHGPLALYIELPVSQNTSMVVGSPDLGLDVFANGREIRPEGPHPDNPQHYQQISRVYDLDLAPSDTDLTLAVRTLYIPFGYGAYTGFFASHRLLLGDRTDLERAFELWSARGLFERLPRLVDSILLAILGLFLLALYFSQRGHPEYLWLALHELLQAPIGFVELAGGFAHLDSLWYAAIVLQLVLISAYLYFEFLIAFLALRKRWFVQLLRYTAPILLGVGPTLLMVGHSTVIGILLAIVFLGSLLWISGWFLFIFVTLIAATIRRNFEAALLLLALILSIIGLIEPVLTTGMTDWSGHPFHSPLTLQAGPIPIHFASIADFTGIFVIVLIIFVRFLRIQRDQEQAKSELAAARSVQELMIPQEKLDTPGFEVDSVYNPANEVGGDFYHVQCNGEEGLLVVIGDVAGKGLKAAMNVSMLMGALRRSTERSPVKILDSLNRVLAGSESFTTCQAVCFRPNGEVIVANAGHLPPYLNSQEVTLPGGLPLGVLPEITYEEVRVYLHPGDRLLLISDGVVEARSATGELFGFDRVHNLSNQSAFYVAEAAKAFGQEDDITVLTVRRLAQTMAA